MIVFVTVQLQQYKYIHLQALYDCSIYIYATEAFLLQIPAANSAMGTAILLHSLPMKSRKRLAHNVIDTCVIHADLVHVRDTDYQTKNGSTHSHIFLTFKH